MARMMSRTFMQVSHVGGQALGLWLSGYSDYRAPLPLLICCLTVSAASDPAHLPWLQQLNSPLVCVGLPHPQGIEVDPNHLALLAGAGAILDTLFWWVVVVV